MKAIDFSHSGGFPLTQDELDYLQQAYTECINALAAMGSDGSTPMIISGMTVSTPTPGSTAVTDGWFFYNGEMIRFTGAIVAPTGTDVPLVHITPSSSSLTYYDGSSFNAVLNKTATLVAGASVTDATNFPIGDAVLFQLIFGLNGRESAWNSLSITTATGLGNVAGVLYYKKNWLNNTLHLRASLTANAAQNFNASPGAVLYLMTSLPSEYIPATNAYFTTYYYGPNLFKDDLGVAWVKQLTSVLNNTGQIYINFIKPDAAISAYSVIFNTIIPLD